MKTIKTIYVLLAIMSISLFSCTEPETVMGRIIGKVDQNSLTQSEKLRQSALFEGDILVDAILANKRLVKVTINIEDYNRIKNDSTSIEIVGNPDREDDSFFFVR